MYKSYPPALLKLIEIFRKLPGAGQKSAERFAFELLQWPEEQVKMLEKALGNLRQQITACPTCGCLKEMQREATHCSLCDPRERQYRQICLVAYPRDIFLIENSREYQGSYHILGGLLSPMKGIYEHHLRLNALQQRLRECAIDEIILALDSTVEGNATCRWIKKELESFSIPISRIAFGLPLGSSFEFIEEGSFLHAFLQRQQF